MNPEVVGEFVLQQIERSQWEVVLEHSATVPLAVVALGIATTGGWKLYEYIQDRIKARNARKRFELLDQHSAKVPTSEELDLSGVFVSDYSSDVRFRESVQGVLQRMRATHRDAPMPSGNGKGIIRP